MPLNEYDDLISKTSPAGGNEYDQLLSDRVDDHKSQLKQSMFVAAEKQPDRHAEVIRLANEYRTSPDFVERNFDLFKKKKDTNSFDYDSIIDQTPGLTEFLKDPNNLAVAKDDIDSLRGFEEKVKEHSMISDLADSVNYSLSRALSGAAKIPALAYDMAAWPQNKISQMIGRDVRVQSPEWLINNPLASHYEKKANAIQENLPDLSVSVSKELAEGNFGKAGRTLAIQFVANFPQQAAIIAGTAAGFPTAALVGAGSMAGAEALQKGRDAGVDPVQATENAVIHGTVEALFERLGTVGVMKKWDGVLFKQLGREGSKEVWKSFAKTLAYSVAAEGNEEFMTSAAQDMSDYFTGVNPEALEGIGSRALDAGIIGGVSGGLMTSPSAIGVNVIKQRQLKQAAIARDTYMAMGEGLEASKLRARLPEAQQKFVESVTRGTPVENVYLSAESVEAYFQSKDTTTAEAMQSLGLLEEYNAAKETGADMKVPLSRWASKVVGTEHYQGLANDIKFSPEGLSYNESQALQKEMSSEAELALVGEPGSVGADNNVQEQRQQVKQSIAQQLMATGKYDQQSAETSAELFSRAVSNLAERSGMNPGDILKHYGFEVTGPQTQEHEAVPNLEAQFDESGQRVFDKDFLGVIRSAVEAGEVIKRGAKLNESGDAVGSYAGASTFPSFFQEKGWTKKESLKVIDKYLAGKKLTDKQMGLLTDLFDSASESAKRGEMFQDAPIRLAEQKALREAFSGQDSVQRYAEIPETRGGKIIDPDMARFLFPEYAASREGRVVHTQTTHEAAGDFSWRLFEARLKEPPKGTVVLMAGGGGSGKSSVVRGPLADVVDKSELVYDGVMSKEDEARERIERVVKTGRPALVTFVYSPLEQAAKQMAERFGRTGRSIPVQHFVHGHVSALENFLKMAEEFKGDPRIEFKVFDNSSLSPKEIPVEKLAELRYTKGKENVDEAVARLLPATRERLANVEQEVAQARTSRQEAQRAFAGNEEKPQGSIGSNEPSSDSQSDGSPQEANRNGLKKLFQSAPNQAPPFYSKLQQIIETKMGGSADPAQIKAMLRDVKSEEMKWSGIEEFLKGKEKVSKAELLDFLRANQLEIKEVNKVEDKTLEADKELALKAIEQGKTVVYKHDDGFGKRPLSYDDVESSHSDEVFGIVEEITGETKFSKYTTPGGTNYREILFTLPEKGRDQAAVDAEIERLSAVSDEAERLFKISAEKLKALKDALKASKTFKGDPSEVHSAARWASDVRGTGERSGAQTQRLSELRKEMPTKKLKQLLGEASEATLAHTKVTTEGYQAKQKIRELADGNYPENYKSSHWSEKNVLAHTRLKDYVDADGKKVLLVEEIQSDWHQAGREKGYKGDQKEVPPSPLLKPLMTANDVGVVETPFQWIVRASHRDNQFYEKEVGVGKGVVGSEAEAKEYALRMYNREIEKQNEHAQTQYRIQTHDNRVPDAPFRKSWHEFVFKRVLRMAAEGGYDRVAWTTGEQQAERYDLSKQVDRVIMAKHSDETWQINVIAKGQTVPQTVGRSVPYNQISEYIGKELGEKVDPKSDEADFSGVDLKVGGEGMKGFYDKILVDFAKKFGKKFGAAVGETVLHQDSDTPMQANSLSDFREWMDTNHPSETVMDQWESKGLLFQEYLGSKRADGTKVHSIEVTPQMKQVALEQGFELFQEGKRGRILINPDNTIKIEIFKDADLSTFLHETGHFYLEVMGDMVEQGVANDQLRADYAKILKWLGAQKREEITVDMHERLARAFEQYLREGKAPVKDLREVFARLKSWLIQVYRTAQGLNVEINNEIRGVFDRLIATNEELATRYGSAPNLQPLVQTPEMLGLTEDEFNQYKSVVDAAKLEANERIDAQAMKDHAREKSKAFEDERATLTSRFEKQANESPIYKAMCVLKKGTKPDGSALPEGTDPIKINRKEVIERFGEGVAEKLKGMLRNDGVSADVAADLLGFKNGEDLVRSLEAQQPKDEWVRAQVEQALREKFPDIIERGIGPEVVKAIRNESRAKQLRMELEYLARKALPTLQSAMKKVASRVPTEKQIRAQAEKIVANTPAGQLKPHLYMRAEIKYANLAAKQLASGDIIAAFESKRKELLNHEIFRAMTAAREELDSSLEKFKKLFRKDEDLAKTRDLDLVNAGRAILALYGIGKTDKGPFDYLKPIMQYDPDQYMTVEALIESSAKGYGPYKEVAFDKFIEMRDSVMALWSLAKSNKEIEIQGKRVNKEVIKEELLAVVSERVKPGERAGYQRAASEFERFKRDLLGAHAALRRVESWTHMIDGKDQGAFSRYVFNPISEAVAKYRIKRNEVIKEFLKIIEPLEKTLGKQDINAPELGYTFGSRAELLGALLHTGNESNLRKLLLGRGWATVDAEGNLDVSRWKRFTDRLANEGTLTKQDYDVIQQIWDLNEKLKPDAQRAHKRMYGFYFNEITANELVTPFGKYRGGYVPAVADTFLREDAAVRADKEALEKNNNSFMYPTTGRGFTKSRVENYTAPLVMDLRLIPQHIDKALRFTMIEPAVKEVSRVVMDRGFRESMYELDPVVISEMIVPWLQRAAQQKTEIPSSGRAWAFMDRVARALRTRTGLNTMVFNFTNTFQQIGGISMAAVKVPPKYLRGALVSYIKSPSKMAEHISEKSDFMKTRLDGEGREISNHINEILVGGSNLDKLRDFGTRHGYFLQQAIQNVIDITAWSGAYDQAIENGMNEADSIAAADAAVRLTQGSFNAEDISRSEVGSATMKLFTMFYSYFNMQANLLESEFTKTFRDMGLRKGAGRGLYVYTMGFMIPAVFAELVVRAMAGKFDDDDDEQYLDDWLMTFFGSQFRTATAFFPVIGPVVSGAVNMYNSKPYDDRISTSPAIGTIESTVKAPASVYDAIVDGGSKRKAVKDTLTALGVLTGLPLAPIAKPVGYLLDVNDGTAQPANPVDFARGLMSGRPGAN